MGGAAAILLMCTMTAALATDPDAVAGLREGARAAAEGRVSDACQRWQGAVATASSNYLRVEALARLAGEPRAGARERQAALGRLATVVAATPPRWLTDETRKVLSDQLAALSGGEVRSLSFPPGAAGSGFRGRRYLWMAGLPALPPPPSADASGRDVQDDPDQLPVPRVPGGAGAWAVVDPWHARADGADPSLHKWRFDRCLLGYTFEPVEQRRNLMGNLVWDPLEPWYATDGARWQIWQLRFRVFYPSQALGAGADYSGLARELLDTLLRGQWVGREHLGRQATDARQQPDILDVWLTENNAEQFDEAGGERWFNNLYFYQLATPRAPAEWVREVLHEYGHAMLPKVGRYLASRRYENWLEGYLGERLLMRCLGTDLQAEDEPRGGWLAAF
ncbi:MAG: hypothetical protein HYU66_25680, partial [Armatimonadetes bacterium]|nr:hypothetical protein [Armatimonadota bacterium]